MLRASFLLRARQADGVGARLARRQELPAAAFLTGEGLERVLSELEVTGRTPRSFEMQFPGLVVCSYAWAAQHDPDPDGRTLREVLCPVAEWYMAERAALLKHQGCKGMAGRKGWWSGRELTAEACDFGIFIE